jgi:hypothetical protein
VDGDPVGPGAIGTSGGVEAPEGGKVTGGTTTGPGPGVGGTPDPPGGTVVVPTGGTPDPAGPGPGGGCTVVPGGGQGTGKGPQSFARADAPPSASQPAAASRHPQCRHFLFPFFMAGRSL